MQQAIIADENVRRIANRKYTDVRPDYDQNLGAIMARYKQALRIHRG